VVPKLPRRAPGPAADRRRTVALLVGAPLGLLAAGAVVAWALASLGSGGDPGPGPGGGSTTVSPPEAQSCQGKGCENQDPERTGCAADAQTATAASHPTMIVYVRYSPSCRAAWGRITNAQPGNVVTVFGTDGASARQAIRFGPDVYSPMIGVPAGSQVWVCGASKTFQLCTSRWRPPAPTSPGS
jgi:hypothetical protein